MLTFSHIPAQTVTMNLYGFLAADTLEDGLGVFAIVRARVLWAWDPACSRSVLCAWVLLIAISLARTDVCLSIGRLGVKSSRGGESMITTSSCTAGGRGGACLVLVGGVGLAAPQCGQAILSLKVACSTPGFSVQKRVQVILNFECLKKS